MYTHGDHYVIATSNHWYGLDPNSPRDWGPAEYWYQGTDPRMAWLTVKTLCGSLIEQEEADEQEPDHA